MTTQVHATFEIKGWDEQAFVEEPGTPKLTRASVVKAFSGDLEGEATVEFLMAYAEEGSATVVGLERVKGTVAGKSGTFVLQSVGSYADGAAKGALTVVPGSGTDGFVGLSGTGESVADPGGTMTLSLTFG